MNTDFRFLKLGLPARLAWALGLYALAAFVQYSSGIWMLGLIAIVAAWFMLAIKPVSNKPKDKGLEEWRAVSMGQITRIADNLTQTRRAKNKLSGGTALGVLFLVLCGIASIVGAVSYPNTALAFLNLGLFSLPGLFFGRVSVHVPTDLNKVLPSFLVIANEPVPNGYVLTPYVRFDKDEHDMDVPENVRCL
ncbi:MAG TPA: hypothetical protein PLC54_03545, partial [Spirochaetales bacterium]|nr:hypothetical protein [Spirochaetales bacterium]